MRTKMYNWTSKCPSGFILYRLTRLPIESRHCPVTRPQMPKGQRESYMLTGPIKRPPYECQSNKITRQQESAERLEDEGGLKRARIKLRSGREDEGQGGGSLDEDVEEERGFGEEHLEMLREEV